MPQWTHVDRYVNATYVHDGSSSQFITLQMLDALFQDNICSGINGGSKPAMLDITYVKVYYIKKVDDSLE